MCAFSVHDVVYYRRTQDELNDQKQEADDLRDALEDRQRDLQQRVDQVRRLEWIIA